MPNDIRSLIAAYEDARDQADAAELAVCTARRRLEQTAAQLAAALESQGNPIGVGANGYAYRLATPSERVTTGRRVVAHPFAQTD